MNASCPCRPSTGGAPIVIRATDALRNTVSAFGE